MKKQAIRNPKLIIILGFSGTGKSTFVQKLVDRSLKMGVRSLICTPHAEEWQQYKQIKNNKELTEFTEVRKNFVFDLSDLENTIYYFRNGLLVFDDCRIYFPNNSEGIIKRLMISRRQKMVDTVVVAHGFTEVPPKFFTFASEIVLFKTKDNIKLRKDVLLNYEYFQRKQLEINKKALKNPHYYEILRP